MSDAISKIIEPFREDAPDYNSFKNLVSFACLAWNTTLLPEEQRAAALGKMINVLSEKTEDHIDVLKLLGELMERKRRLFPNVTRMIMEYKVTERGHDFHIAIASTTEKSH